MPSQNINGVSLNYLQRGRGPAVILLHGFPLDNRMWQAQAEALSDRYRVIAPDFRGFGKSMSTDPFAIELLADDVHGLIQSVSAAPAVVAGLSMGGYVALAYVRKYAATLRGLVLLDTKAAADTPEAKEGRGKMIELVRAKGAVAVGDAMQPKLVSPDTVKNKPAIVKRLREMTDKCPPLTVEHALEAMRDRPDLTSLLPTIRTPTLLVVGDADSITPPSVAEEMHQAIPGSQIAVIRGSGHMAPMEQPEQVSAAMRRFLAGLQ